MEFSAHGPLSEVFLVRQYRNNGKGVSQKLNFDTSACILSRVPSIFVFDMNHLDVLKRSLSTGHRH